MVDEWLKGSFPTVGNHDDQVRSVGRIPQSRWRVQRQVERCGAATVADDEVTPVFGKGVCYDCEPERMMEQLNMLRPALQI